MPNFIFTSNENTCITALCNPHLKQKVIAITEHIPQGMLCPDLIRMPILLPEYKIISNYIDTGDINLFYNQYINFLRTNERAIFNILLLGIASKFNHIIVYTTPEEWNPSSIPFFECLINYMVNELLLMNPNRMANDTLMYESSINTVFDSAYKLYVNKMIRKDQFDSYMETSLPSIVTARHILSQRPDINLEGKTSNDIINLAVQLCRNPNLQLVNNVVPDVIFLRKV